MLTFKRYSLKSPENDQEFFTQLYWDNVVPEEFDGFRGFGVKSIFTENPLKAKKFAGEVDRTRQEFSVRCNGVGLFKQSLSIFEFSGRLKKGIVSKTIEVGVSLHWRSFIQALWMAGIVCLFLSTFTDDIFTIVLVLVMVLRVLLAVLDFNMSEEKLKEYVEMHRRIQSRRVVSGLSMN